MENSAENGRGGDMPGGEEESSPRTQEELDKIAEEDAKRQNESERRLPDVGFEPMSDGDVPPPDFDSEPWRRPEQRPCR